MYYLLFKSNTRLNIKSWKCTRRILKITSLWLTFLRSFISASLNLAITCKTNTSSVLISGNVPKIEKGNGKASKISSMYRRECNARNICLIDNKYISSRFHCNKSLYLNYYERKKLQENLLYELAKLDWQSDMVGMYISSIRVRNNNKDKRKRNKKVNSRNSVEKSFFEVMT